MKITVIKRAAFAALFSGFCLTALFGQVRNMDNVSTFNLRDIDLRYDYVDLEGDWDFYWESFPIEHGDFSSLKADSIRVPAPWNRDDKYPVFGYGTYRCRVLRPPGNVQLGLRLEYSISHYKIFINGSLLRQFGTPGTERVNKTRDMGPEILILPDDPELDIVIQMSNYYDFNGGLIDAPQIGSFENLTLAKRRNELTEAFLFGVFFIIGAMYILFHLGRPTESRASLFFGLFAMVLAFRTLLYGEHLIILLLPNLPFELTATLGHITFYAAVPLFLRFMTLEYPFKTSRFIEPPVYIISGAYIVLAAVTRHHIYINFLTFYQIIALAVGLLSFAVLIKRALLKDLSARLLLLGYLLLLLAMINDILYSQGVIESFYMVPLGLGVFIMGQAILLSRKIGKSLMESRLLSKELSTTNKSFRRFVPEEFLTFLNKSSVTEIELGDHEQLEMTVMFLDIRDFTSLSEKLTPRENFLFLNSYYSRVCPVIRDYGGFIDKYLGDGIMALFPGPDSAENAVQASIKMKLILKLYNIQRARMDYEPIRVGIGIHTGTLMMGTIGEHRRMDSTVISDAVNLCSRIESLTKEYGLDVALSEESYNRIDSKDRRLVRYIGQAQVKGKEKPVRIYELFDGDTPSVTNQKLRTRELFEKAVRFRDEGRYDEAQSCFQEVQKQFPEDRTTVIYLSRFRKSEA